MALKPGDILRDKYRIDALIGRGGMGHVFAATDLHSRDQVAVKVVSRANVDDVLLVRLHREAEAATRIQSEYVPRVIEVSGTDEGETFFAMERLHGETLSQRLRKGPPVDWSNVFQIGEDILHALVDAHAAGVVHRDLKPSNVFLARRGPGVRAMLLDFGVCKMAGVDAEQLTGTGESIGTVAYMAPEQVRGAARVDERADLFAFGVLVFEMLTGRLPHEGPSQMAILANKLERPALPLRDYARIAVPEGTDELVMRAIERDPANRFPTADGVLVAWRALSARVSIGPSPAALALAGEGERDVALSDLEAPTEISRPPAALIALSASDQELHDEGMKGNLPSDFHPTQTALSTHYSSSHRRSGVVRGAVLLACAALVGGLTVVALAFTRGSDVKPVVTTASSETIPAAAASVIVAPEAIIAPTAVDDAGAEAQAAESPTIELRSESEDTPVSRAAKATKAWRDRHRSSQPQTKASGSGQRITEKPRY